MSRRTVTSRDANTTREDLQYKTLSGKTETEYDTSTNCRQKLPLEENSYLPLSFLLGQDRFGALAISDFCWLCAEWSTHEHSPILFVVLEKWICYL